MTITIAFLLLVAAIFIVSDIQFAISGQRLQKLKQLQNTNKKLSDARLRFGALLSPPSAEETSYILTHDENLRKRIVALLELTLLGVWAIVLGSEYLNMDPHVLPAGREFGSAIPSHHFWTQLQKCGLCALWNGSVNGGYPALADIQGSMLHPLVMVTTLIFGVVNGVKVSLIAALWIAGLAQWWIAKELRLSWLPRIWSAMIAMAGGHLAARMELGVFGVVLSTAMASLIFAGILHLENSRSNRAAVLLGMVSALTIISGQGYIQAGMIGILPATLFFFFEKKEGGTKQWAHYLFAFIIALLLAAPLLVPLGRLSPNIYKATDIEFSAAQPLKFFVLNLVIDDPGYYFSEILGKWPYPHLYSLFIGWLPMILAIIGIPNLQRKNLRVLGFLLTGIVLAFLIASGIILKPLAGILPPIAGVRHSPQIAGLAIPMILGLSAYGLEAVLNYPWPNLFLSNFNADKENAIFRVSLLWVILVPFLLMSLKSNYVFSKEWLYVEHIEDAFYETIPSMKTDTVQWVEAPFGEHAFIEPAIAAGLKLSPVSWTWNWKDREFPEPKIYVLREGIPSGNVKYAKEVYGLIMYENQEGDYASVETGGGLYPCDAEGSGGFLTVSCETSQTGILTLKENAWSGWRVWMDGKVVKLESDNNWLKVRAPAGKHSFTFKYLPWDVPLGLLLFTIGMLFCAWLWLETQQEPTVTSNMQQKPHGE